MTVSSTSSRVVYAGNGSATSWSFAFKVQQAADLAVVYTDLGGTDFPLSPSQYSVSGLGLDAGGSVGYPVAGPPIAAGTQLTICRNVALTQPSAISNQGAMWPNVIEAALDRLTYMAQAVSDAVSRSLRISPTDGNALAELPNATTRGNSVLAFDNDGQPYAATLTGSLVGVATWLVNNFLSLATSAANACTALSAFHLPGNNTVSGSNTHTGIDDHTGGRIRVPTRAAGDNGTDAASTAFAAALAQATVGGTVLRSHLAGLGLSTAGGSATFSVAAGAAADATNAAMLALASATTKTTSAWVVGAGNGGLDGGTIASATWYHVYLIKRVDTGLVDVVFSLSAGAPALPANYTLYRRLGSMKTDGSAHWLAFSQNGDDFLWLTPVRDVNATNQGTSAVTLACASVPPGVVVDIRFVAVWNVGVGGTGIYLSPLAVTDQALSASDVPGISIAGYSAGSLPYCGTFQIRSNTSQQFRARADGWGASETLVCSTTGWIDRRGRDA